MKRKDLKKPTLPSPARMQYVSLQLKTVLKILAIAPSPICYEFLNFSTFQTLLHIYTVLLSISCKNFQIFVSLFQR